MAVMLKRKFPAFKPPGRAPGRAREDLASRTRPPGPADRTADSDDTADIDVNRLVWDPEYRDEVRRRLKVCG